MARNQEPRFPWTKIQDFTLNQLYLLGLSGCGGAWGRHEIWPIEWSELSEKHLVFETCSKTPTDDKVIVLMDKILHHQGWWLSHYSQCFNHPRWCRISSIKSMFFIFWGMICWAHIPPHQVLFLFDVFIADYSPPKKIDNFDQISTSCSTSWGKWCFSLKTCLVVLQDRGAFSLDVYEGLPQQQDQN